MPIISMTARLDMVCLLSFNNNDNNDNDDNDNSDNNNDNDNNNNDETFALPFTFR